MPQSAHGSKIRLAGSTVTMSTNTLAFVVSGTTYALEWNDAGADFNALGVTSGMRMVSDSTNNTRAFTVKDATSTRLQLYEACTDQAAGSTISCRFFSMGDIGEVRSIGGPNQSVNFIDVTHLGSTGREYIPSSPTDPGEVTFDFYWRSSVDDTCTTALTAAQLGRTLEVFDIILGSTASTRIKAEAVLFDAYVQNLSINVQSEQALMASITLRLTSEIKWIPETTA